MSKFIAKYRLLIINLIFLIMIGLLSIVIIMNIYDKSDVEFSNQTISQNLKVNPTDIKTVKGKYLFTGTIVWDRGVEEDSIINGQYDYSHPFSNLDSYQPNNYDAWFADLECPIDANDIDAELGHTLLQFNCLPDYLPYARKYFDFFNLANNHSDNSGRDILQKTYNILEDYDFQYFGDPDSTYTNNICEIIGLPVRVFRESDHFKTTHLPIAVCALHYFYRLPQAEELEVLKDYAKHLPVFAFIHMGSEYSDQADQVQQSIARNVIDSGAEFVIANNPHWVQNSELYKGKLIVYSTGNFIFDQAFNEEVKRSISIISDISFNSNFLEDWLAIGPACIKYKDNCFNVIKESNLDALNLDLRFDVVAGYIDRGQPQTKADYLKDWAKKRLEWPY